MSKMWALLTPKRILAPNDLEPMELFGIFISRKRAIVQSELHNGRYFELDGLRLRMAKEHLRRIIFRRDSYHCVKCGSPVTWETGELHEKVPRSQGGERTLENCETLCKSCHTGRKGAHGFGSVRKKIGGRI